MVRFSIIVNLVVVEKILIIFLVSCDEHGRGVFCLKICIRGFFENFVKILLKFIENCMGNFRFAFVV